MKIGNIEVYGIIYKNVKKYKMWSVRKVIKPLKNGLNTCSSDLHFWEKGYAIWEIIKGLIP